MLENLLAFMREQAPFQVIAILSNLDEYFQDLHGDFDASKRGEFEDGLENWEDVAVCVKELANQRIGIEQEMVEAMADARADFD